MGISECFELPPKAVYSESGERKLVERQCAIHCDSHPPAKDAGTVGQPGSQIGFRDYRKRLLQFNGFSG
jgi:hypothetical protein